MADEDSVGGIENPGSRVTFDLAGWFNHRVKSTPRAFRLSRKKKAPFGAKSFTGFSCEPGRPSGGRRSDACRSWSGSCYAGVAASGAGPPVSWSQIASQV
jgi:hypothetical protein